MEPTFQVLTDVAEKMVIPLVEEGSKNKSGQQSRFVIEGVEEKCSGLDCAVTAAPKRELSLIFVILIIVASSQQFS